MDMDMDDLARGPVAAGSPDGPHAVLDVEEGPEAHGAKGESPASGPPKGAGSPVRSGSRNWPMSTLEDLKARPKPEWLIDGILQEKALAVLYGQPGAGKTFLALDMALSVATGSEFHGLTAKQGRVVYLAVDSLDYLDVRCEGWLSVREAGSTDDLLFCEKPVTLNDARNVVSFTSEVRQDGPVSLVVIDTLAHCNGGDENSAADMQALVNGARAIRNTLEAAVLLIHHTPKLTSDMRGSGALRAGVDTAMLFELAGDESALWTLSCTKQRNAREFPAMQFERAVVPVGTEVTVVMQPAGSPPAGQVQSSASTASPAGLEPGLQQIIDRLEAQPSRSMMQKDLEALLTPIPSTTVTNRIKKLASDGRIRKDKQGPLNRISLIDQPGMAP